MSYRFSQYQMFSILLLLLDKTITCAGVSHNTYIRIYAFIYEIVKIITDLTRDSNLFQTR